MNFEALKALLKQMCEDYALYTALEEKRAYDDGSGNLLPESEADALTRIFRSKALLSLQYLEKLSEALNITIEWDENDDPHISE